MEPQMTKVPVGMEMNVKLSILRENHAGNRFVEAYARSPAYEHCHTLPIVCLSVWHVPNRPIRAGNGKWG
ncbi:MAG: hypothetical protein NVS4B11_32600 [Ktedonobacteraceae bacterium]